MNEVTSVIYRSIEKHEQGHAIDFWHSAFGLDNSGCFERDFSAEVSPNYQERDVIGAWCDGKLVSTVYIQRIIIQSDEDDIKCLCGGICDVGTLEKYRKQGLSRHLLRLAIEKMEKSDDFDLSMLRTGQSNHYSVLGWEPISAPHTVLLSNGRSSMSIQIILSGVRHRKYLH